MNTPPPDRQLFAVEGKAHVHNSICYWRRIAPADRAHVPNTQLPGATPKRRQFAARRHCPRAHVCPWQRISLAFDERKSVPKAERAVGEHGDEMLTIGRETRFL